MTQKPASQSFLFSIMAQFKNQLRIRLDKIQVEGRLREDLGDIENLAKAIETDGLLQPIVVEETEDLDQPYRLVAGGRRYAAFTLLAANKVEFSEIPSVTLSALPAHTRVKLELEENLRRKDMTWQEKVIGIARYHKAAERAALLDKDTWSQEATGELLGMDQTSVSIALKVAKEIAKGNEAVIKAESMKDAISALAGIKLDEANKEMMRRIELRRAEQASKPDAGVPQLASSLVVSSTPQGTPEAKPGFSKDQVAAFYHEGNALTLIPKLAQTMTINHIVCDPPYGIDMDNLVSDSVERIEDTHKVESNLELLPEFLSVAFNHVAIDGFLCMWYDLDHHEKIKTWAEKIGWRVQRWPLVWCKTSACRNSQAQYNITKATEVCYFLRRSEQSIIKKKQPTNFVLAGSVSTPTHPFPKPSQVWDYCIDTVSLEGQIILDPFAGEGSSLAAIFNKRRIPVGIEIDPTHIASGLGYVQDKINAKDPLNELLAEPPL